MPAHITLLYPFLPERGLDHDTLDELARICTAFPAFVVAFTTTARFPDVLYLVPEPADLLEQMTLAIAHRWPDFPPYAGQFDDIVPHLTVAIGQSEILDAADAELRTKLPLGATVDHAQLLTFDGGRWKARMQLPFG
jgi:2'-5' RNA ligase